MTLAMLGLPLLVVMFIMGIPVVYGLLATSLYIMLTSTGIQWVSVTQYMINGLNSFTILSAPLFLLAGTIMNCCSITDRLFKFCELCIGWLPGGLGHVNVLASFVFAGMSGTAIADATGLGLIEIRAMEANGYDKDFACSVTATSSCLGPIIPPSMPLVVYGTVSGASVGALFIAGVLPGVIMALLMMVLVSIYAVKNKYPRGHFPTLKEFVKGFFQGIGPLLTPVIILLGIYTGICTPTEAAAVVVAYSMFLGVVVYREVSIKEMVRAFRSSVVDVVAVCVLVAASTLFGAVIVRALIPQTLVELIVSAISNKYVFLIVLNLVLLVVGMFMETVSAITILTPIIVPIAKAFDINLVHLGVIMVLNLMIGVVSPPFGVVLFALNKVGSIPIGRLIKAMIPWYICLIIALALVSFFPALTLWLPSLM